MHEYKIWLGLFILVDCSSSKVVVACPPLWNYCLNHITSSGFWPDIAIYAQNLCNNFICFPFQSDLEVCIENSTTGNRPVLGFFLLGSHVTSKDSFWIVIFSPITCPCILLTPSATIPTERKTNNRIGAYNQCKLHIMLKYIENNSARLSVQSKAPGPIFITNTSPIAI